MLASTMSPATPIDSLLKRIQSFLDDLSHPGYGTLITTADGASVEVTLKPLAGEDFETFARRVLAYAGDAPVVWTIQDRKIPIARVTRKLS